MSQVEQILFSKLQAFSIFLDEGIETVKTVYPEYVDFVLQHKDKTFEQVEKELRD